MDLMQMQQRVVNPPSTANTSADTLPGSSSVSTSSDDSFSRALGSALGLDESAEADLNTVTLTDPQILLSSVNGAVMERQDMPPDNGLLPVAVIMPGTPVITAQNIAGNMADEAMQGASDLLENAMRHLKFEGIGTNPKSLLPPLLTPVSSLPVSMLNAQDTPVLLSTSAALIASSMQNKVVAGAFADFGKTLKGGEFQASMLTSALDDNTRVPIPTLLNVPSSVLPNVPTMAGSITLNMPLGAQGWGQELGNRVQWMVTQGVQAAALQINPPHLGPIEVRISMDQDKASLLFHASHMMTRDAIEASIPRLRDMFNDSGLNLVNVNVSSNAFADQRGQQPGSTAAQQTFSAQNNAPDEISSSTSSVQGANNLVDYYA